LHGKSVSLTLDLQVQAARDEMQWAEDGPPPLLVKIAPDLSKQDLEDIAAVAYYLSLVLQTCLSYNQESYAFS
jgi:dihydroorotate dehydrogenase